MSKLSINIISQDAKLQDIEAESLTATTTSGEVTILPNHSPLFSLLSYGTVTYRDGLEENVFLVSQGFLDVGTDNVVTIIVDSVKAARDISLNQAQAAVREARSKLEQAGSDLQREELLRVEAALKQALLEEKVARRTHKTTI